MRIKDMGQCLVMSLGHMVRTLRTNEMKVKHAPSQKHAPNVRDRIQLRQRLKVGGLI